MVFVHHNLLIFSVLIFESKNEDVIYSPFKAASEIYIYRELNSLPFNINCYTYMHGRESYYETNYFTTCHNE